MALRKLVAPEIHSDFLCPIFSSSTEKQFILTPYIGTFSEGTFTDIDIGNFLESGLKIIRFKISHVARTDKVVLLSYLQKAITWCCAKHEKTNWPVAVLIDLPNACIMTGYISDEIKANNVYLEENSIVEVTTDIQYWNKCDNKRIFIDDMYTLPTITPTTEISINFGAIIMVCTEFVNDRCIKCRVLAGGRLENAQFVCIKGVKLKRPALSRLDRRLLDFVKEYELDAVAINSIREPATVGKVRAFFQGCRVQPSVLCTICEQEGLDSLDEIIQVADGIILAREFLSVSVKNPSRLLAVQLYASAKCRQHGKPFYISGKILENTLNTGNITWNEISDVTNAVLQGAGFVLRPPNSAANLVMAMETLNEISQEVEKVSLRHCFWHIYKKLPVPVNAAEAAMFSCAMVARQTSTEVVIVLSVTGWSARKLTHFLPTPVILAVSANESVCKQLLLHRGLIPIVYNEKGQNEDWYADMDRRVQFAVEYAVQNDILKYKNTYVVLRKGTPASAFCDQVSVWKVIDEKTTTHKFVCPDHAEDSESNYIQSCQVPLNIRYPY